MGEFSKIPWCDATFNPWWGCMKVDSDCKNCYAETLSDRWGFDVWGKNKPRRFFKDQHWNEPLKWNEKAAFEGKQLKVFCGSMMDWAEDRPDLEVHRERLFFLIDQTPNLNWLLLTKRPENISAIIPDRWRDGMPENVWCGTSVGHNGAKERIDEIKRIQAKVIWLSCEPQTELLEIHNEIDEGVHWIVCGGESGNGARPFQQAWAENLLTTCREFEIPFFMKQFGAVYAKKHGWKDVKGEDIDEFPKHLQVREFPTMVQSLAV